LGCGNNEVVRGVRRLHAFALRADFAIARRGSATGGAGPHVSVIMEDMRADEFVTRRRPEWDRLEKLLARAGTGRIGGLRPTEVLSLAGLYRRATADLARAKRDWPTEPVAAYLNGLVARGHAAVYRGGGNAIERLAFF